MNGAFCWKFLEAGCGDLEFSRKLQPWQTSTGKWVERWLPYGMPTVSQYLLQTILFMYRRNPRSGEWEIGGTGFVVGMTSPFEELIHVYAVTNYHVAVEEGCSSFRTHGQSGSSFIELDPSEWLFPPQSDDLAIADITGYLDRSRDQVRLVHHKMLIWREEAERIELGFGDDVFMLGMFANSPGDQQNAPAARFGNISRIPTDKAPVEQPAGVKVPSYLVDMRSRTGFSGSPVFVYRTATDDLRHLIGGMGGFKLNPNHQMFHLLGIHCSQYPEVIQIKRSEALGDPIREGDRLKSPGAMNVVVPAWRILDLLDCAQFKSLRAMREADHKSERDQRPEPESVQGPPTKDKNPRHKENFDRLLDAAVKGPKSDD